MMPRLSSKARWMATAGPIALIAVIVGVGAQQGIRRFDSGSFCILDLTLGKSEVADLTRTLGTPLGVQATETAEGTIRCYASTRADKTVLEFEDWFGTLVEFRFYSSTAGTARRCARTNLVSAVSTGNGLKLGMDRNEVLALLGRPTRIHGQSYVYESAYNRPLTAEEERLAKSSYHTPPQAMEVYEKIELKFNGSRVTLVDVVRNETW